MGGGGGGPGAWIERLRIVLPSDFDQLCRDGRLPTARAGHEVLWQALRALQARDERRPLGEGKLMHWLTTSKHINQTGFSRMRVGLAIAVLIGTHGACEMADVLQLMRYEQF